MLSSLVFNTTRISFFWCPALFRPSKQRPPLKEPSPITAIVLKYSSGGRRSRAHARPHASETALELWPVVNTSNSDSSLHGKPVIPRYCRREEKASFLPVSILWA